MISVFSPPVADQSIEVPLAATPGAVSLARRLLREWFGHWGAPDHVIEKGQLVTSELVTNAVKAKGPSIRVRMRWSGSAGYVEVWDADPNPPVAQEFDLDATSGRGLFLVAVYAERWDYYSSAEGKVVWAKLSLRHVDA